MAQTRTDNAKSHTACAGKDRLPPCSASLGHAKWSLAGAAPDARAGPRRRCVSRCAKAKNRGLRARLGSRKRRWRLTERGCKPEGCALLPQQPATCASTRCARQGTAPAGPAATASLRPKPPALPPRASPEPACYRRINRRCQHRGCPRAPACGPLTRNHAPCTADTRQPAHHLSLRSPPAAACAAVPPRLLALDQRRSRRPWSRPQRATKAIAPARPAACGTPRC
jgi:hypothetical protein